MSTRYIVISYPDMQRFFPVRSNRSSQYIKERGIDSFRVIRTKINKRGKEKQLKYWHQYNFNNEGEITHFEGSKKGKLSSYSYDYLQGVKWNREIVYKKKGKLKRRETMIENFDGAQYSRMVYVQNIDGDTVSKTILNSMDTTTMTGTDYFYKKGKLNYKWFNEYYPNRSKKRTTVYNKKGKEKFVWDYQCKDEGVEIKKHKDTSTVCVSKEYDKDSILTEVHHYVGEKGNLIKTVLKYNKKHQMILYKRVKGSNEIPMSEYTYTFASNDTILTSSHSKQYWKGKLGYEYFKEFDVKGDITSNIRKNFKRGKLVSETNVGYRYDAFGRPAKKIATDVVDGTKQVWYFTYR